MKRFTLSIVAVMLLLSLDLGAASTVRGKLIRQVDGRTYPVPGILVRLRVPDGSPLRTYSASDGMFYLYNVRAGTYTLEVVISNEEIQTYSIRVEERPYTDIAPIRVR